MNDLKLSTLLCAKICHDLITPVGAIGTGLEFIVGGPNSENKELQGLLNESAQIAAQRLVLFRCVYGSQNPSALNTWDKIFRIMDDFTRAHNSLFVHSNRDDFPGENTIAWGQCLLGMMYVMSGTCQEPFQLSVKYDSLSESLVLSLRGPTVGLKSQKIQLLENRAPEEEISSHNILEYLLGLIAFNHNIDLHLSQGPGEFICYLKGALASKQSIPSLF